MGHFQNVSSSSLMVSHPSWIWILNLQICLCRPIGPFLIYLGPRLCTKCLESTQNGSTYLLANFQLRSCSMLNEKLCHYQLGSDRRQPSLHALTRMYLMCFCQAKRLKDEEEMLAKEKWELAAIEEQRRVQDKEHAKVEFRYRVQTGSTYATEWNSLHLYTVMICDNCLTRCTENYVADVI